MYDFLGTSFPISTLSAALVVTLINKLLQNNSVTIRLCSSSTANNAFQHLKAPPVIIKSGFKFKMVHIYHFQYKFHGSS